jgi:hypothetical protein
MNWLKLFSPRIIKAAVLCKNVAEIIQEEFKTGKIVAVLTSRKVWGPVWMLAGHYLKAWLGVDIEQATWDSLTDIAVLLAPYALQLWGALMTAISIAKTVINKVRATIDNGPATP